MFVSPAEGRVTSHWGPRERHPVTGARGFHRGIDIAPPRPGQRGVPVYACYGGTVRAVRTGKRNGDREPNPITGTWNTGNYVLIDGPGGGSEWYGHLETIVVAPGDKVQAGDRLGTMGDSGNVTGVHLHLEMWNSRNQGGGVAAGNTRDPRIDFKAAGVAPGSAPVLPKTPVGPLPPAPGKTPTSPFPQEDIVASIAELDTLLGQRLAAQNAQLHTAIQDDITRLVDDIVRKRDNVQNTALHNMVRRELALAIGNAPGVDIDTLAPRLAGLLVDDVRDAVAESIAEAPGRDAAEVADAVVSKIAHRLTQED